MEHKLVYHSLDTPKKDWKTSRVNNTVYRNMTSKTTARSDSIFEVYPHKHIFNLNSILFSLLLKCTVWHAPKSVTLLENSMSY